MIVIGTTLPEAARDAAVLLPIANFAEEEGTFTNLRGRVQRPPKPSLPPGLAPPAGPQCSVICSALSANRTVSICLPDVFAGMPHRIPHSPTLSYDALGMRGLPVLNTQAAGAGR